MEARLHCHRMFGQPKLVKPKYLNNKTLLGSIRWSDGQTSCMCKVWLYGGRLYVLHRDWFSRAVSFAEADKLGIAFKRPKDKFVYNDNFGGVILRNEAIISFNEPNPRLSLLSNRFEMVKAFATMLGCEWCDLYLLHRWEDFIDELLKIHAKTTQQK